MSDNPSERPCCSGKCGSAIDRRAFVRLVGLGAGAVAAGGMTQPVMAGPFERADFAKLVPADKKLRPEWIKTLFAQGGPQVYRGADLEKIGMPVGGICAGQLYLGGDGRLWYWDIFNQHIGTGAAHYAKPLVPEALLEQGFALRLDDGPHSEVRPLDRSGFAQVSFCGEYPLAQVDYGDGALPVTVSLEAFSPFVPLAADDSGYPATVLQFTVKNISGRPVRGALAGWLENGVAQHSRLSWPGQRHNQIVRRQGLLSLECSAVAGHVEVVRPPVVFADFEGRDYDRWRVEGTAFGAGPVHGPAAPNQHLSGFLGRGLVNSWPGSDAPVGRLLSPEFKIEHAYISFLIGGGNHPGQTCINLVVNNRTVRSSTGKNSDAMQWDNWPVRDLRGKTAHIEIIDRHSGPWGHIDIDQIEFRDRPRNAAGRLEDEPDFGTMTLSLLDARADDLAAAAVSLGEKTAALFAGGRLALAGDAVLPDAQPSRPATADAAAMPLDGRLTGALGRRLDLPPGHEAAITFLLTWHFPNLRLAPVKTAQGRHYAQRFASAAAVTEHLAPRLPTLAEATRLWHDNWYDSTLPRWFLDRTMLNTSILATSTCHRLSDGRFYGWEGVGCCDGTCTHVWHYAHAVARLFPELERDLRQRTDFGLGFNPETGVIRFRGEGGGLTSDGLAVDGQAGCILRTFREHQMSPDDSFLRRLWPRVKLAMRCLMNRDNGRGLIDGPQHNTLDSNWFGPVAWLSGLYLAALRACDAMAHELDDLAFAAECRGRFEQGRQNIAAELFESQYFINKPDPKHLDAINSGTGCHIDQVFGQSWAHQVGLGMVIPREPARKALESLWRYNFTPDVGPYRAAYKPGRWYAMAGEAGLLMCTFPRADWDYNQAAGKGPEWAAGYFNECMTGFEYQVAGHMLWEGMLLEGLAIARAIHDRYHPSRRNPWNEVECGDHYARAMASYGLFVAMCGFEYHGPRRHLGYAPRLRPENFRAAFTAAEGWGRISQARQGNVQHQSIAVRWGQVRLKSLGFVVPETNRAQSISITAGGAPLAATATRDGQRLTIVLRDDLLLTAGQRLEVVIA